MSHLLSLVVTSLDRSGKVCLSSVHSNVSVTPTYACVWIFETALEITGHKAMGPRNITADGRVCCMLCTSSQSAHLRRQRGGCCSSTDLVVVQHMCLSGFDRLDPLIQKEVYSFNYFRCSWNRASQSRCLQR